VRRRAHQACAVIARESVDRWRLSRKRVAGGALCRGGVRAFLLLAASGMARRLAALMTFVYGIFEKLHRIFRCGHELSLFIIVRSL